MLNIKKLDGGGDKDLEQIMEDASLLGVELIEVMWTKSSNPRYSVAEIVGFKIPFGEGTAEDTTGEGWVEGRLRFYPDKNGRCWGYIFDDPKGYNRELIKTSFCDGWFKVVDNKTREVLLQEAKEKGYQTEVHEKTQILIKKTKREKEAEDHIKNLQNKLQEYEEKMKRLTRDLSDTEGKKAAFVEKRLKGVKIDKEKYEERNQEDQ